MIVVFYSDHMWNVALIIGFVLLASAAYASSRGAPWVPTWKRDLKRIEKLAQLKEGDRFVELGCGTGRVCRHLAKQTKAQTHGVELSVLQWAYANLASFLSSRASVDRLAEGSRRFRDPSVRPAERALVGMTKKTKFFLGDAFHHDLSSYNVVYMFLMPKTYQKIRDKFTQELASGARVITYVWPMPGWTPLYVDRVEGSPDLYVYEKK